MLEDALTYPLEGDDAVERLLVGSGLLLLANVLNLAGVLLLVVLVGVLLFPLAFLVSLPVAGYLVAVLRTTAQGAAEPPAFGDWGRLFVDGLKATLVVLAYSFVPSVLFLAVAASLFGLGAVTGDVAGGVASGVGLLVLLLAFPVYLLVAYVTPAALTNFAVEDDLGAAFAFGTVAGVVTDGDYVVAAVVAVVVSLVAGFVATLLNFVLVGILVSPFIYFYVYVVSARLFAGAYAETTAAAADDAAAPR